MGLLCTISFISCSTSSYFTSHCLYLRQHSSDSDDRVIEPGIESARLSHGGRRAYQHTSAIDKYAIIITNPSR